MFESFSPANFMPLGHCYLWEPALLWSHVVSDAVNVLALYAIPLLLIKILKQREDIQFGRAINVFGMVILLCETIHLISILTAWQPVSWLSAAIKVSTALVSMFTAYFLWRLLPQMLALPSPAQLQSVNQQLKVDIHRHQQTEKELNKFSLALENSPNPGGCRVMGFVARRAGHRADFFDLLRRIVGLCNENDIPSDRDDAALVTATISLVHNLGLKVVAEGVETQEQMEFLKRHGCMAAMKSRAIYSTRPSNHKILFSNMLKPTQIRLPIQ